MLVSGLFSIGCKPPLPEDTFKIVVDDLIIGVFKADALNYQIYLDFELFFINKGVDFDPELDVVGVVCELSSTGSIINPVMGEDQHGIFVISMQTIQEIFHHYYAIVLVKGGVGEGEIYDIAPEDTEYYCEDDTGNGRFCFDAITYCEEN